MKTNTKASSPAQVAQHTPGPWKVIDGIGCGTIYSIQAVNPAAGNGVLAAVLHAPDKQRPLVVAQANARLIAAAPELLQALQDLLRADEQAPSPEQAERALQAMTQARAALAKAQGGQP